MINLEKQKENFKNHVATLTDYGNIKIIDFKNPKSNEYRIRFLFEEDYYRLHISGDLGELIATNYCNMTFEKFSDFVNDVGYFEGKIDCHNRNIYYYDEEKAEQELLKIIEEENLKEDILEDRSYCDNEEDAVEDFINDILSDFENDTGLGSDGRSKLSEYIDEYEAYEISSDLGKEKTGILDLYMLAFKLAMEQLNKEEKQMTFLNLIEKLKEGKNIGLVSDAGTPGICDPGEEIIKKCIEENIKIIPIPGACAMINALICSGISTKEFSFFGFLPLNKKTRKIKLEEIQKSKRTIILYEAPHKLLRTLNDILENIGDVNCTLAKEITKIHENFIRGSISEIIAKFEEIKGEYVIILDLNNNVKEKNNFEEMSLEEHYLYYEKKGMDKKEIIKQIAKDKNTNKNEIYQKFLKK